jgi:hypothetical protein
MTSPVATERPAEGEPGGEVQLLPPEVRILNPDSTAEALAARIPKRCPGFRIARPEAGYIGSEEGVAGTGVRHPYGLVHDGYLYVFCGERGTRVEKGSACSPLRRDSSRDDSGESSDSE